MVDRLRLALAQLDPCVGDLSGNAAKLKQAWQMAGGQGADLVVGSELCLTGYPLEDFAFRPSLLNTVAEIVGSLTQATAKGPGLLIGAPWLHQGALYNAALLLDGGKITPILKHDLPNYGPFDERRVYASAPLPFPAVFRGIKLGVMICEDMWSAHAARHLRQKGAQILIVPNGSPYERGKFKQRQSLARDRVQETGLPLVYVNQMGGQDELVFDGASFAVNVDSVVTAQAKSWEEDLLLLDCPVQSGKITLLPASITAYPDNAASVYHAMMTGLRDYVRKNGFDNIWLGLSGGIDSALVAAVAVDALGADKVHLVMLPSPYTSQDSLDDAAAVAKALGCRLETIPISEAMAVFAATLAPSFAGKAPDLTEENIQARCRGLILMGLSNKHGGMVLATGNKSEMAVGYATLYGDMCGGYAPLKDVYKTEVYQVSRWRNMHRPDIALGPDGPVMPERILTKAPTAELRPNQTDQDSLPPYDVLDDILSCLIEQDMGVPDIAARGHAEAMVARVFEMLHRSEYKRRQAPPGPKVTRRHLTRDRRYPITNRYKEK